MSTPPTGGASKASVEAHTAVLVPCLAMYELVLNLHAPKSSGRTLSELYTHHNLEYPRTVPDGAYARRICTERDFQARWKEFVGPMEFG